MSNPSESVPSADVSSASVDGAVEIVDGVPKTDEATVSAISAFLVPTGDEGL